jgi:hypothetical protein
MPVNVPEAAFGLATNHASTYADFSMTTLELGNEQQAVQPERRLVGGRYRLHARIGRGRLGEIYEADDEGYRELGVGGRVAIQLLPGRIALDQGLFSKLKLGYTLLRAGSHPNIVSYLDADHDGKFGYVVMEFLDGASLRLLLDDISTLPLEEALPVIRAVGDALQFLHAKSMVHGELTTEKVFVTDNLEIRLLDVVPLNSASKVLRGAASKDPFSRADTHDDIYALACLAYEILAGRHPFNFHPPAEVSQSGLEPARIPSLPEQQWNAIRRGLSFDTDNRPATVREFLDELGVTGTERLRRSDADPVEQVAAHKPAISQPAPALRHSPASARTEPAVMAKAVPRDQHKRDVARTQRKRASLKRSFFLLVVLAGMAAWYHFGQPHDDIAKLTALVESYVDPVPDTTNGAATVAAVEQQPAEPVAQAPVAAAIEAPGQAEAEPVRDAPEYAAVPDSDAETADEIDAAANAGPVPDTPASAALSNSDAETPVDGDVAANAQPVPDTPASAALSNTDAATPVEGDVAANAEPVPDTPASAALSNSDAETPVDGDVAAKAPASTLIQSLVTVSEGDGAARIAFRRPVGTTGTVVWWTADETAIAESDYIALEQPVVGFAAGEEAETLHVPLINDGLPEPGETFYVFLGQRNPQSGQLERIARIRVDINDDD